MLSDKTMIQKYEQLKKFCPDHTLLNLITIQEGNIILSEGFNFVYKPKNRSTALREYSFDLERALQEEHKIQEIRKFRI